MLAAYVTPAALRWLQTTTEARCLSWHRQVGNLINPAGEVLALLTQKARLVPFGLVVELADELWPAIAAQTPVWVDGAVLHIGPLALTWQNAQLWSPKPDWAVVSQQLRAQPHAVPYLLGWAQTQAAPESVLHLAQWPATPLAARFAQSLVLLAEGLRANDAACITLGVSPLVGAGGGLTPAGDDFLVGVFLALWALRQALPPLALDLSTTALARAFVAAALHGECAWVWHELLRALGTGERTQIQRAGAALLAFGHTSGADALAGFGWAWAQLRPPNVTHS